jgi:hypothetical protein
MMGLTNEQINSLRAYGYYIEYGSEENTISLKIHYDKNVLTEDQAKDILAQYHEMGNKIIQDVLRREDRSESKSIPVDDSEEDVQINTEYVNDRGNK